MTMLAAPEIVVRRPRYRVYIGGKELPHLIDINITRGMDQEVGSCTITYPYPLPNWVAYWHRVQVLMSAQPPQEGVPYYGLVERFVGYVINFEDGLWPGTTVIQCEDRLTLGKNNYTPEDMDLGGDTDVQALKRILGRPETPHGGMGLGTSQPFEGHNLLLTELDDTLLYWPEDMTALEMIQQIDETSMGYRTMCTPGGLIIRKFLPESAKTVGFVHHFQEGVDILEGSATSEIVSPINEIQVTGFDVEAELRVPADEDPFYWRRNRYWQRWLWLRAQAISEMNQILPITELAAWLMARLERRLIKVTLTTHLDILFMGMEVVKVTSARLKVNQNFWVQSVNETLDSAGQYSQTLTLVSDLIREVQRPIVTPPVIQTPPNIPPGSVVPIPTELPGTLLEPSADDITPTYTIVAVERELATPAAISGNQGFIYTITFQDMSTSRQGQIVSRTWTAIPGGVVIPVNGTELTFTTTYTDLASAQLTLEVTDSNGSTASITGPVDLAGVPVNARKLYACTDTTYEAFDGTEWRSQAPVAASAVGVVAGGPWWGAGGFVAYSADDLQTPAVEVEALPGETIISIWKHESVEGDLAVGGDGGNIGISHDKGTTWEVVAGPGGPINFIIVSIHDPAEIHVVTPDGWFKSQSSGQSWDIVAAGAFRYLELSHSRNIVVTEDGVLQKGEDGTPFVGNTSPIVAATAHIRQDKFYAIAEDGTTWIQETEGSYDLVPGEPIPAGQPYHAGAYRDGLMVDLVYFAAQEGGLFKTLDGFRTADGYMRLRADGEITP